MLSHIFDPRRMAAAHVVHHRSAYRPPSHPNLAAHADPAFRARTHLGKRSDKSCLLLFLPLALPEFYCRDYIAERRYIITAIRSLDSARVFLMRLYDHAKHAVEWLPTPNGGDVRKASYPYQSQIMLSPRYQAGLRSI